MCRIDHINISDQELLERMGKGNVFAKEIVQILIDNDCRENLAMLNEMEVCGEDLVNLWENLGKDLCNLNAVLKVVRNHKIPFASPKVFAKVAANYL